MSKPKFGKLLLCPLCGHGLSDMRQVVRYVRGGFRREMVRHMRVCHFCNVAVRVQRVPDSQKVR